ncbi:hypothetical protein [Streptomyces sp. MP131-18]|uniref:hypothetical protein n=1 Tax=Streptomyces sp. MP131-18 TaxID=1857892 RepID=UPI00097C1CE2|nr:hypothetical protein [Streptomyces sp. MP131-18]ONK12229.1 hypothetical protein STBA_29690 [Streptomyces sp. MP131-18]
MSGSTAHGADHWESLTATLLITKSDLNPDDLTQRLGTPPDFSRSADADAGARFRGGVGCWALRTAGDDVPGALGALLPRVAPLIGELAALRAEGHRVQINVAGGIDRGRRLTVPGEILARVAGLGLPLSFTTESAAGNGTEEFLDSLARPART